MGNCMIPWSQYMPNWLANWVFLVGMLFELFSGSLPYTYVINLYIVDVCVPEDRYVSNMRPLMSLSSPSRTAALSKVAGWAALGLNLTCRSRARSQITSSRHMHIICSGRIHYDKNGKPSDRVLRGGRNISCDAHIRHCFLTGIFLGGKEKRSVPHAFGTLHGRIFRNDSLCILAHFRAVKDAHTDTQFGRHSQLATRLVCRAPLLVHGRQCLYRGSVVGACYIKIPPYSCRSE